MKKLLVILCLLCLAPSSYAVLDRNYFEYDLTPSGAYTEDDTKSEVTTTTESVTTKDTKKQKKQKVKYKRKGFSGQGSGQASTYWDFGRPNYGFTGDIQ